MDNLLTIVGIAIVTERLVKLLMTDLIVDGKVSPAKILSMIVGVGLCLLLNLDFFGAVGMTTNIPLAGTIVTGLMVSGGSNFMHDIIKSVKGERGV